MHVYHPYRSINHKVQVIVHQDNSEASGCQSFEIRSLLIQDPPGSIKPSSAYF